MAVDQDLHACNDDPMWRVTMLRCVDVAAHFARHPTEAMKANAQKEKDNG